MIAIFLPRKTTRAVNFRLSKAQQNRVVRQCEEINSMIREVHDNLSDIRKAGTATSRLARETHAKHLKGRNSLRRQQQECERINGELKKISDDMRAVRENVTQASRKSFLTVNRARELEKTVAAMSATSSEGTVSNQDTPEKDNNLATVDNPVRVDTVGAKVLAANVVPLARYKSS